MGDDVYTCPVCGWPLNEEAWSYHAASDSWNPSWDICPCCGTEFGYQDFVPGGDQIELRKEHKRLRRQWIAEGYPWHSSLVTSSSDWDPVVQLQNAGLGESE
jgi:hypothetical protein